MIIHKPKISIIIADDHQVVIDGIQAMLSKVDSIEIIGEAKNGDDLIALTRRLKPDVVLVDIQMPKCNGIEATKRIKKEFPHIGVVALSTFDEEVLILDMVTAGAKGYLLKNTNQDEMAKAIHAAYKDDPYYCTEVTRKLSQIVSRGALSNPFNPTELRIIVMICEGYTSRFMSLELNVKERTVDAYRKIIMKKMDVTNVAAMVTFAIKYGYFRPSPDN